MHTNMNGCQCEVKCSLVLLSLEACTHDIFTVKVTKVGLTVGHVLKKISLTCSLFISNGGVILSQQEILKGFDTWWP